MALTFTSSSAATLRARASPFILSPNPPDLLHYERMEIWRGIVGHFYFTRTFFSNNVEVRWTHRMFTYTLLKTSFNCEMSFIIPGLRMNSKAASRLSKAQARKCWMLGNLLRKSRNRRTEHFPFHRVHICMVVRQNRTFGSCERSYLTAFAFLSIRRAT